MLLTRVWGLAWLGFFISSSLYILGTTRTFVDATSALVTFTSTYIVSTSSILSHWKAKNQPLPLGRLAEFFILGATCAIATALPLSDWALAFWNEGSPTCVMMTSFSCHWDDFLSASTCQMVCPPGMTCETKLMPLNDGSLSCNAKLAMQWVLTPGLIEEASKAVWLRFWLWLTDVKHHPSAILLCGMSLGAGFETAENLRYAFPTGLDFSKSNPSRAVAAVNRALSSYLHVAWTGAVADALAHGRSFIHALLRVVVLHGLYDYGASLTIGLTFTSTLLSKLVTIPCVWLSVGPVNNRLKL